jgi:hypothetical protein
VDLRLVGACTHDPVAIGRDTDTGRRFLELEILKQLDAVCVLGILLETALAFAREPFRQRSGAGGTRDGIYRHGSLGGELHGGDVEVVVADESQEKAEGDLELHQTAATFLEDPAVWVLWRRERAEPRAVDSTLTAGLLRLHTDG